MGTSTDGILAYGYNLGGTDGWELKNAGEYGDFQADWYDEEKDEFATAIEDRLLAVVAGFTETWETRDPKDGFFVRRSNAQARIGVDLVGYCSGDYPLYILAAHEIRVARGDIRAINPGQMAAMPADGDWDGKLATAVAALGVEPKQEKPGWLLVSNSG